MKKPRKSTAKGFFKVAFWLVCVVAAAWIAFVSPFATHAPHPARQETVRVAVAPPEEKPEPPLSSLEPAGDEKVLPAEKSIDESAAKPEPQVVPIIPPAGVSRSTPKIAIVIDDVGLDLRGSQKAIDLPAYVTLSFMPYATRLREQTHAARDKGHELLLHMPMEPLGNADPGPGALLVSLPPDDIRQRFQTALASFTGFDGVNNHMGSKFTGDSAGMTIVIDELKQRHLFYLDSRTSPKSVGFALARQHDLPTVSRDVFLDDDPSARAIKEQLAQTEAVARRKGYAIAIGHPHAATMQVLAQWLPEAERDGFTLVPLNNFIRF